MNFHCLAGPRKVSVDLKYDVLCFLSAHASEQGNVIGSVRIYIYIYIMCVCVQKKIVIERTRDLTSNL